MAGATRARPVHAAFRIVTLRSPSLASAILSGDPQDGPYRLRTGREGKGAMHRLAMIVASLMLALGLFSSAGPAVVTAQDGGYSPDDQELAFVNLLNDYRTSLGLNPLSINYQLGAAADYHSYDMATNNYFDHYLFDGTDPGTNIRNFGYYGSTYGENIAAGLETAQEVLTAWQNSPGHNAEMTNPHFTEVGVGRFYGDGSYYGWYWTADFGGGPYDGAAPADNGPADAAPADTLSATDTEPAPVISPDSSVTGNAQADGSTTTYQEPPTVITNNGNVVELPQTTVNADGDRAVSTGANPVANGTGDTVIYGDINTGGIQGESIVYEPPSLTVDDSGTAPAPAATEPVYTDSGPVSTNSEPVNAAPAEPVYTDPTFSETTVTNISMEDGKGRAIG
jgi:uncharacterized protein YkwD